VEANPVVANEAPLIPSLFGALQAEMLAKLGTASVLAHPDAKGDQAELNWYKLLDDHLPRRYLVLAKATVIDHRGNTSDEIDLLIVDRQYSPFVFHADARTYVPAESVYAVLECKQGLDRRNILYASEKISSARKLQRTTSPIVHAGGTFAARSPGRQIGGLLTSRVDWKAGIGPQVRNVAHDLSTDAQIDIGCAIDSGGWSVHYEAGREPTVTVSESGQSVMFFMLTLLEELQKLGTVTALDFSQWRAWITTTIA
jgi:hypothetical protein